MDQKTKEVYAIKIMDKVKLKRVLVSKNKMAYDSVQTEIAILKKLVSAYHLTSVGPPSYRAALRDHRRPHSRQVVSCDRVHQEWQHTEANSALKRALSH